MQYGNIAELQRWDGFCLLKSINQDVGGVCYRADRNLLNSVALPYISPRTEAVRRQLMLRAGKAASSDHVPEKGNRHHPDHVGKGKRLLRSADPFPAAYTHCELRPVQKLGLRHKQKWFAANTFDLQPLTSYHNVSSPAGLLSFHVAAVNNCNNRLAFP